MSCTAPAERAVEQYRRWSRWTTARGAAAPEGRPPRNRSTVRSPKPDRFDVRRPALRGAVAHRKSCGGTRNSDNESGRRSPTTGQRRLATGNPGDNGNNNCAVIVTLQRISGRRDPARRGRSNGIGRHRARYGPASKCQGSGGEIANGSGEVPSPPNIKTIEADIVLVADCIKIAEEP
jgi:hypothetical protein